MQQILHSLFALTFISLTFCDSSAAEDLTIGGLFCLSGDCSSDGTQSLRGVELAIEEQNNRGGVLGRTLKLVVEDTREGSGGVDAVTAFKKLRADPQIRIFVGPTWSTAAQALAPIIAKDHEIMAISPTVGVSAYHLAGSNIFNSRGTSEATTRALAKLARDKGLNTVAILSSQQPWEIDQGNYFADEFTKLGGSVKTKLEPPPSMTDTKTLVLKIAALRPELVFFSNLVQMPLAAKEMKQIGFTPTRYAAHVDRNRLDEARGALDGALFAAYPEADQTFTNTFQTRYKSAPEMPAATAYDAVQTIVRAIELAQSTSPASVATQVLNVEFDGASGRMRYDSDGGAVKDVVFWKVDGDQLSPLNKPVEVTTNTLGHSYK